MLCQLCHGMGNLITTKPKIEWWSCPACEGRGARFIYGPAIIHIHSWKAKMGKRHDRTNIK